MAAPVGNPNNPSSPFDIQKLFNFPNPNPNPTDPPPPFRPPPTSYANPPPPNPFFPPQQPHPFLHPRPSAPPPPFQNPNPNPNHGARLMALLGTTPQQPIFHPPPSAPPATYMPASPQIPARIPSSKQPRGRRLPAVDHIVYDVDAKLPGEREPPQLEVTPITKYSSDPTLLLGRQIAVNGTYICYGLKQGSIRVLNLNTALRALLKGHTQRVADMSFFAEDVSLLASASVEGRVFVWKIDEGLDEENRPQITGKVVIAIQMGDDLKSYHPRVCWHPHKQEVLVVGIGNILLKIDTTKVKKGQGFSAEEPLLCAFDKLMDGVQFIGKHDGEVTDLSMSQWLTTRLVSASKDGTVKIWEDRKPLPLATLRPHNGQPVYSAAFLTSPQRPDHIVLVTAGPLNRELKIWTSAGEEGWLLPSDSELWQCTQTLDLISSAEPQSELAFFNQMVVLPKASLIILANAKKNTVYVVHVDYGPYPSATRMDHIADFTVTMPILSLTGTSDFSSDGEHVIRVSCVQPQAIQQYALDVFQCLPPLVDNDEDANESSLSRVLKVSGSQGFSVPEPSFVPTSHDLPIGISSPNCPTTPVSSYESAPLARFPSQDFATTNMVHKPSAPPLLGTNTDISHVTSSPAPVNLELPKCTTALGTFPRDFDQGDPLGNHEADQKTLDYSVVNANMSTVTSVDNNFRKVESKGVLEDLSKVPNSTMMFIPSGSTTHLITPAEILSGATSSSESSLVIQDLESEGAKIQDATGNTHVEQQVVVCESGSTQDEECVSRKESHFASAENIKNSNSSQTLKPGIEVDNDSCTLERESCSLEKARAVDSTVGTETLDQTPNVGEDVQDATNSFSEKAIETATSTTILQPLAGNGTNQMTNSFPGSAVSTPFTSPFTSTNSSNVPENSCPADAAVSQLKALQDMLSQLMTMQKETHQKISAMVSAPITKEGRRVEVALGRSMEKAIKANVDALWGNFQEENAKHEKIEKDRIQQVTSVVTNFVNKDLPAMLERTIKKEISGVAPVISRTVTPAIEKSVSSAIVDSFQRGVGDKAVNQLEKSVNSKLEATVARQIQSQFQTSGKQALQDGLRSSLESKAIPAFENSCKAMFEQVSAAFQKGMAEHTAAALEQVESVHTPLASTLREAIGSASSITQNLANELADGQRKILALITAGNTQVLNPMAMQLSNGLPGVHLEMLEKPLDPKKELTRLISERKFEEAFTLALQRSDVSIVSWLCSQVDLHGIGPLSSLSLSQGVLLSLLQQLACDISNETSKKVGWMRDVAVAINLTDPMIMPHVRPIFEQVYSRLLHHRSIPTTTASEATGIQVTMHVINSLLMSCK